MTAEDTNVLMGEHEIYCGKERDKWRFIDKLSGSERHFNTLVDLLDYIELEILSVEIGE